MYPGAPQDLVGKQVADAGDPVLVHEPGLDRCRGACRERGPELGRRDQLGVGPQLLDGRVEPDAAKAPRVDEQEAAAILEGQAEASPAVIARLAAAFPVVAAVDLGPARVGDHDLARHAQVNAERHLPRSWVGPAPHALSPSHRGDELAANQRMPDFPRRVRAALIGVGVVDVSDAPP
jgi:hypothetical protein